jgi:hypothetical protein
MFSVEECVLLSNCTKYCSFSFEFIQCVIVIATGYGLDTPGIKSWWGARFSASIQTGPEAHPVSCTMGTGSFPEVKWLGRGADHPPPSSAAVTNE